VLDRVGAAEVCQRRPKSSVKDKRLSRGGRQSVGQTSLVVEEDQGGVAEGLSGRRPQQLKKNKERRPANDRRL